jgi:hypothetical protein
MIKKIKRNVGLLANLGNSFIDKIYFFKELLYPQSYNAFYEFVNFYFVNYIFEYLM